MNTADEIRDLIETTGMKAPDMTQALKNIGGDMQSGIKRIGKYFHREGMLEGFQAGKHVGEKSGFVKGSVITLAITTLVGTGLYLYDRHKTKVALEAHEAEGKVILEGLKAAVSTEEGTVSGATYDNYSGEAEDEVKNGGEL